MNRLIELYEQDLKYYFSFTGTKASQIDYHKQQALGIMQRIAQVAQSHEQETSKWAKTDGRLIPITSQLDSVAKKAKGVFDKYYSMYAK